VQPDRIDLHRDLLGLEIGTGEAGAGLAGNPAGRTPTQNRKVVRVSEDRKQQLALHDAGTAADRTWGPDAQPHDAPGISDTRIPTNSTLRSILNHHAMLQCSPNARYIPFGENMTIQIFSFSFRCYL
jgi:hypothetical protein